MSITSSVDRLAAYYGPFTSDREKEVLGVPLRLVAAWAESDADAVAAVFTEDGTLILPGGVYKVGREQVREFMKAAYAGPFKGSRVIGQPVSLRFASDDVALIRTHGGVMRDGETEVDPALAVRSTWICVRAGDEWQLAGYQNSPRGAKATLRW